MNSSITRTLAVLASLAACSGFVSSAGAQVAPGIYVTVSPTTVSVNLNDNPSFELTYKTNAYDGVCSSGGEFSTAATGGNRLGGIKKTVRLPNAYNPPQTAKELVTIPASVLEEIKRRRITSEIYYRRDFATSCTPSDSSFTTAVKIPVLFASVEAAPHSARVAAGTDTPVSLRWKADIGSDVSYRVESREGRFVDSRGRVYGPVMHELLQATGRGPLELSETLRVPESVVKAVLEDGESGVRYERLFSFVATQLTGTIQVTGAMQLSFAGRIASPFSIDRAELQISRRHELQDRAARRAGPAGRRHHVQRERPSAGMVGTGRADHDAGGPDLRAQGTGGRVPFLRAPRADSQSRIQGRSAGHLHRAAR